VLRHSLLVWPDVIPIINRSGVTKELLISPRCLAKSVIEDERAGQRHGRLEVWRLLDRCLHLGHGEIADADHADIAI
jgi:hypothetical protein